jgi:hypothetical protein
MSMSDTQKLRILKSPDALEATTTSNEMATGLEAIAHKFKDLAQDLREGKMFTCPACGSAAFAGTDTNGDYHIDLQLHFKATTPIKGVAPN